MELGHRIEALRKAFRLSRQGLAGHLGVTPERVAQWEEGTAVPEMPNILEMCTLFDVTADALLTGNAPLGPDRGGWPHAQHRLRWRIWIGARSAILWATLLLLSLLFGGTLFDGSPLVWYEVNRAFVLLLAASLVYLLYHALYRSYHYAQSTQSRGQNLPPPETPPLPEDEA